MSNYLRIGQKFSIGSRVNKKRNIAGMSSLTIDSTTGTVVDIKEKLNSRKRPYFYYTIKWDNKRTSEHGQHLLVLAP